MNHRENRKRDRFAFALGSYAIASTYAVLPLAPNDRIAAAWDERLGSEPGSSRPASAPQSRDFSRYNSLRS